MVEGKIPMAARRQVTNKLWTVYARASKRDKARILDEAMSTTGMGRSTARRMLAYQVLPDPAEQVPVEISLTRKRGTYARREWTSAAIVVSQAIALLPGLAGLGALRAVRAARLFRVLAVLLRLFAVGGATAKEGSSVLRRKAARFALLLAGFVWLTSPAAFTLAEDVGTSGRVHSFGDALWWSSATITTVGYGDIFPITPLGRFVGVFTMVVGISTFAVVTAKAAEFLVHADLEEQPS